jgi:hypothetical protein
MYAIYMHDIMEQCNSFRDTAPDLPLSLISHEHVVGQRGGSNWGHVVMAK